MTPRVVSHRFLPALLLSVLACAVVGCGGESGPPVPNKTVPEIPLEYEGRPLSWWRSVGPDAPEAERAAAAFGIAALEQEPDQSGTALIELLNDSSPSVRLAATVAVGRLALPWPRAAERIVSFFDAREEPLRRHAREAAGTLGPVAVPALQEALSHAKRRVRWAALLVLGKIGLEASPLRARVADLAREDPDAAVRRQALFALARFGPEGVTDVLSFLGDERTSVREEAAAAVLQAGEAAVQPVAGLLTDPDEERAALAAGILADLGPAAAPAMPALLQALERPGPLRFNAAEALISLGDLSVPHLEERARSDDEGMAAIARYALDEIRKRK